MTRKSCKPEEAIPKLWQLDVLHGQGMSEPDAIREIGVSEVKFFHWRSEHGDVRNGQLKRIKELHKDNE